MSMRIRKIRLLVGCVIIGAVVGFILYWWLAQYYFPVRDVAPIVNRLEKGDLLGAQRLISGVCLTPDGQVEVEPGDAPGMFKTRKDPNRIRIRGRGADKVKHAILMILNSSEDMNVLHGALRCAIIGAYNRNVLFDKQSEREILEKAVARYNAHIPAWAPEGPWSVIVGSDGNYYVQMGWVRSQ
jgi:hypothetical protein